MKYLISSLIFIQIICNLKLPWKWNFYFNDFINTFDNITEKISTTSSLFFSELQHKLNDFKNYAEERKNEIIENSKIEMEKIYEGYKRKKSKYIKAFIEKTTEVSHLLSYKICDIANINSYEKCRNEKKIVFSKILDILKE